MPLDPPQFGFDLRIRSDLSFTFFGVIIKVQLNNNAYLVKIDFFIL